MSTIVTDSLSGGWMRQPGKIAWMLAVVAATIAWPDVGYTVAGYTVAGHAVADENAAGSPAQIISRLSHEDPAVRQAAALAIRSIPGEAATTALLAAIDHSDPAVRFHAIYRFFEQPDPRATDALVAALDDTDANARRAAAQALSKTAGRKAADAMVAALTHADSVVRTTAAFRFKEQPDPRAVEALSAALDDKLPGVRRCVARALAQTPGDEATEAVLASIDHADHFVRASLVARFHQKPDARAVEALTAALSDEDLLVRRAAVRAIGRCVGWDAATHLFTLLDDEDLQLRTIAATALRTLHARLMAEGVPPSQSSFGLRQTLTQLLTVPPPSDEPEAFVEMTTGDRLACHVVRYSPRGESPAARTSEHLVVRPRGVSLLQGSSSARSLSGNVRISTRWIRRIVWQRRSDESFQPCTVYLQQGGRISFRSLRWEETAVVVLTTEGIRRIAFEQIAELHLHRSDPWDGYFEQLAILGCDETTRLLRFNDVAGSRLTASIARFLPFHGVSDSDPLWWTHVVQPAWSLDPLSIRHQGLSLRSSLPPEEVPLFEPRGDVSPRLVFWPWRADRSVQGEMLWSGGREYRWGFSAHADCTLSFLLPPCPSSFRTELGLDRMVGQRGCARGMVRQRRDSEDSMAMSTSTSKTLYRSPLLLGCDTVVDTGDLEVRPSDGGRLLELVADSAHDDRPTGADPLNICDMVDWLQPRLYIDEDRLRELVSRRVPDLLPAWSGWQVDHGKGERLRLASRWRGGEDGPAGFQTLLSVRGPVTLMRSIAVDELTDRLVLDVWRTDRTPRFCRLEVRIDGKSAGVYEIGPCVELPGTDGPNQPAEPPKPIVISLKPYRDREVAIEIVHLDSASDTLIDWQSIRLTADDT